MTVLAMSIRERDMLMLYCFKEEIESGRWSRSLTFGSEGPESETDPGNIVSEAQNNTEGRPSLKSF